MYCDSSTGKIGKLVGFQWHLISPVRIRDGFLFLDLLLILVHLQAVIRKTSFKHPADVRNIHRKSKQNCKALHFHFDFAQMLYEFLCFEIALTSEDNMADLSMVTTNIKCLMLIYDCRALCHRCSHRLWSN